MRIHIQSLDRPAYICRLYANRFSYSAARMMFEKNKPIPLVEQSTYKGKRKGLWDGKHFVVFDTEISGYSIGLKRARRWLSVFEKMGAVVFGIGMLLLFVWQASVQNIVQLIGDPSFWFDLDFPIKSLFWLGIVSFCYLWYRILAEKKVQPELEHEAFDEEVKHHQKEDPIALSKKRIGRKQLLNIFDFMTDEAKQSLDSAYKLAHKHKDPQVIAMHLFISLLSADNVAGVFIRLGIPVSTLQSKLTSALEKNKHPKSPVLSEELHQIIFQAYNLARKANDRYIRATHMLVGTVGQSEFLQELLYDLNIDQQKLLNVLEWVRVREQLYEQYQRFRAGAAKFSKYGMDRAMTAVATPFLNSISTDLTIAAKFGRLSPCVAREKEIDEIFRIIKGGRQSVLLVGEQGVGRMSIIHGIAQRMLSGDVPERLSDKRLVQISTSSLLAGATVSGAQERLIQVMNEVAKAKNIILVIENVHDLVGVTSSGGEGLDVSETLAEYVGSGTFLTLATTTTAGYNRHIVNSAAGQVFAKVEVKEMDENQAIQVLESKIGGLEYKHKVFFSYDAIEACVTLATKFLHDQNLPENALSLITEAASYVESTKGQKQLVTKEDVGIIVGQKTGIPTTSITEDESQKLMRLEAELHKRVIGQDEAVISVANALRRARAEIRSSKKPIATFLFLGPTGVGKTELAKTIADVYFGGEDRMIRFDMSEYQDKSGIYRMIGQPGQQGTGLLTEAVRQNPFSLLLLDELEKADPNVLNLFLQVFDDGRLTDSVGRVIDFTNVIIIATSNAGTAYVQQRISEGADMIQIKEELLRGKLKEYYRPEFLNRFDGIILFRALQREEIKQVAGLMLKRVEKDLAQRGVGLRVEDGALEALAEVGFDPEFGARPMRRAIQDNVENKLAELILEKKLNRRDTIVLGEGASITVEHP